MDILEEFVKDILLEKRRSKKVTLYHGTSTKNLKSILANGLLKDPPKAVYGHDDEEDFYDPYDSFIRTEDGVPLYTVGGVYFTNKPGPAIQAAYESTKKAFGGFPLIVQVQLTDKSLILDEDTISPKIYDIAQNSIKEALTGGSGDISYHLGVIAAVDGRGEYGSILKHILEKFIKNIESYYKLKLRLQNDNEMQIMYSLLDAIISYLTLGNISDDDEFVDGYASELSQEDFEELGPDGILEILYNDIRGSIDHVDYDDQWLAGMDFLTKRLKAHVKNQMGDAYRIEQNIGFRGQNKITAIVAILTPTKAHPFVDYPVKTVTIYGTPTAEFLMKAGYNKDSAVDMRGNLPELMKMLDNF
jgi:hypothetical protein